MAFESFEDLARVGLKRVAMGPTRVLVKSEVSIKGRTQTLFRFSDDLIEKAGWTAGKDRITLSIERTDLAIRARRTLTGRLQADRQSICAPLPQVHCRTRHADRRRTVGIYRCRRCGWRNFVFASRGRATRYVAALDAYFLLMRYHQHPENGRVDHHALHEHELVLAWLQVPFVQYGIDAMTA
jgi:ribosomal protein L37AE/L43A